MSESAERVPEMITLQEAAGRLGLTIEQVRRLITTKKFCPIHRLNRQLTLVGVDDLNHWLAGRRIDHQDPGPRMTGSIRRLPRGMFEEERNALREPRGGRRASG